MFTIRGNDVETLLNSYWTLLNIIFNFVRSGRGGSGTAVFELRASLLLYFKWHAQHSTANKPRR